MANFCTNCGQALEPKYRFCPRCGAAVPQDTVRIREDGKGGLIFDVPEGTTVTISDAPPSGKAD